MRSVRCWSSTNRLKHTLLLRILLTATNSPHADAKAATPQKRPCLLYVDPGGWDRSAVEPACDQRQCALVLLHSAPVARNLLSRGRATADEICDITVPAPGQELKWAERNLPDDVELRGVLCGSDGGLADAERLQDALLPGRSNGINPARRDKYRMVEAMRAAGLAAAEQATPRDWKEASAFLATQSYPVVMKPRRGQGSVLVGLARDEEHARRMHDALRAATVSLDDEESGALVVQEFLEGEEWIVDTVSADGEHKVLTLWRYGKGEENGVPFCYYCDELMPASGERERLLIEYATAALDATRWRWGPCHLEIKMARGKGADGGVGPVLVEINAGRWNGDDFQLISRVGTGYDPVEATLDALLDDEAWARVPSAPPAELMGHGRLVHLVSSVSGVVARAPAEAHAKALAAMPSLYRFEPRPSEAGAEIKETIDLTTRAGIAYLLHADADVVRRDYEALRELQPRLFEIVEEARES